MGETVGIMGGSYNPVHIGHLMLASYLSQWRYVDKIWMTLSPQNPLKTAVPMMSDTRRLAMLQIATKDIPFIDICDIELTMPRPSYTINTLDVLAKRFPDKTFKLIIGSDNWAVFEQWRDYQRILDDYGVIVYPRVGFPIEGMADGMEVADAPLIEISSTFIRNSIARGKNMQCFCPPGVYKYICAHKLYQR